MEGEHGVGQLGRGVVLPEDTAVEVVGNFEGARGATEPAWVKVTTNNKK